MSERVVGWTESEADVQDEERMSGRAHYARFERDASSGDACSRSSRYRSSHGAATWGCVGLSGQNAGRAWSYAILLEKGEGGRNETLATKNSVYERNTDES
jgi:hypothetical protein